MSLNEQNFTNLILSTMKSKKGNIKNVMSRNKKLAFTTTGNVDPIKTRKSKRLKEIKKKRKKQKG